jgi:hypothetical protein
LHHRPAGPAAVETDALIPLAAAGRDPLFFFGTLMDDEVLSHVVGRPLAADELLPARLDGFRRVTVAGSSYPMLVADPAAGLDGRLLRRASRRDILRINWFESEEYRAERHRVRAGGRDHLAWLFRALDGVMIATGRPWRLDDWRREHKAGFLERCAGWMADCPH